MKIEERKPAALPSLDPSLRVALVIARFYDEMAMQLEEGARRALSACGLGGANVVSIDVPGCFEIPLAAKLALGDGFDACVALGVVIRGETPHFDYVAGECARGIMDVQLSCGKPIGFGILTTNTRAQAQERADPQRGDKGYEAALAAASLLAIKTS